MGKVILIILLALGQTALAQDSSEINNLFPSEERYLYKDISDVKLVDSNGKITSLSKIWYEKPILLTLIFSRCAGICSPLISSLKFSVDKIKENKNFYIVVLSFDTADTQEDMKVLKEGFELGENENWIFGVFAEKDEIKKLSKEIGFWYKWVDSTGQYDHPGIVVGIRQGKIVRILVGGNITLIKLREVVQEIKGEFVPFYGTQRNVAFKCLNYDPETGNVKIGFGTIILFIPALLTLAVTLSIFYLTPKTKNKMEVKNASQF